MIKIFLFIVFTVIGDLIARKLLKSEDMKISTSTIISATIASILLYN